VAAYSSGTTTASCKETGDILLNGGCSVNVAYATLGASYPMYQTASQTKDGWWCAAVDNTSAGVELTAYVTCITAP
jgi:hypothetical protein